MLTNWQALSLPDLTGGSHIIWILGAGRMKSRPKVSKVMNMHTITAANVLRVKDYFACVKGALT